MRLLKYLSLSPLTKGNGSPVELNSADGIICLIISRTSSILVLDPAKSATYAQFFLVSAAAIKALATSVVCCYITGPLKGIQNRFPAAAASIALVGAAVTP